MSTAQASEERPRRAEAIHDFSGKLRQPGMWPKVVDYLNWQRSRRQAQAVGVGEPALPDLAPLSINLDLTTACNYACDHCIDWDILNSKVRHDDDQLRASMSQLARRGMRSVILIGGGEPTLYPGFASFVEYLKTLGLQVAIVSNGSRNDRILAAAPFLDRGDWVRLSLDSASDEVFRTMHKPSRQTLSLDEICSWVPKIKAANPELLVGFSFVITWKGSQRDDQKVIENLHEMVAAAERARAAGFDYISFKPFLERSETGSEVMDPDKIEDGQDGIVARIRANVNEARQRCEGQGFRVLESTNLRVLEQGNWRDFTVQPQVCHMQVLRQVVTPGGLFSCPAHRGVDKAKIDGKEAYSSDEAARNSSACTADILSTFDASKECSSVTCLYHGVNWFLEDLIAADSDLDELQTATDSTDFFL